MGFLIACGDASVSFEALKKVLNFMPFFVDMLVKIWDLDSILSVGYDGGGFSLFHKHPYLIAVVACI